jgi:hypothetical protein
MINMAASLELDDESSEGWALGDSGGDVAYVDKPMVRSQLFYAPVKKSLTKGRSEEGAPLEKEGRRMMIRRRRARHPAGARQTQSRLSLSNPCLISSHRNMPPRTARMRLLTTLRDLCLRSMRNAETS